VPEDEARRVLDRAFNKRYLRGECAKDPAATRAGTWTELDRLRSAARARGQFRPRILQRVEGSFTRAGADEILYAVALGDCVDNGWTACVDLIVTRGGSEPPIAVHHGGWGGVSCTYPRVLPFDVLAVWHEGVQSGWQTVAGADGGTPTWEPLPAPPRSE
jgi:hypothetical protein